jgi:hypothetical protein
MDALKAMGRGDAEGASDNGVVLGGESEAGKEVVVRFVLLEERGPRRDWRATSKKWALDRKPPALTSARRHVLLLVGIDVHSLEGGGELTAHTIDRLQLRRRGFLCSAAVPARQSRTVLLRSPKEDVVTCDSAR